MVKFYIPSVSSLLVPPSLSFAGRTPIKMSNCFRGEQKSSSKLEVFHFSYKLSWTFQIDLQPSPDHDNMPCGLGDSSVLNPVWIQELWSPYHDFQLRNLETKNWNGQLQSLKLPQAKSTLNRKQLYFNWMQCSWLVEVSLLKQDLHTLQTYAGKLDLSHLSDPLHSLWLSWEHPYWGVVPVTLLRG